MSNPPRFITVDPVRVCRMFQRIFGLRDGIKQLQLTVTSKSVDLSVVYLTSDEECGHLESLEEFVLVPKEQIEKASE
jgi:hypothetical protein